MKLAVNRIEPDLRRTRWSSNDQQGGNADNPRSQPWRSTGDNHYSGNTLDKESKSRADIGCGRQGCEMPREYSGQVGAEIQIAAVGYDQGLRPRQIPRIYEKSLAFLSPKPSFP